MKKVRMKKIYSKDHYLKKNSLRISSVVFVSLTFVVLSSALTLYDFLKIRARYTSGDFVLYPQSQVLGIQAEALRVSIDFSSQVEVGHPDVFGGAHAPRDADQNAWDLLRDIGVSTIRRDFYMEYEVPSNTTIEDYIANKKNVQDIKNWNWNKINETTNIYKNAKNRGMKTIGIVAYSPKWLTYSGTNFGIPKNWTVFEDIVKKSYTIHRPYLDALEIWNEPDLHSFIDTSNSGLNSADAYTQIFIHAAKAIREVDRNINDGKRIPIGGGVISNPDVVNLVDTLLRNKDASSNIDFVSYHAYGKTEPTQTKLKQVLSLHDLENLPIYLTEWNQDYKVNKPNPYISSDLAIPYVGTKLMQYLKEGIQGANYFSTTYSDPSKPGSVFSVFGIYTIKSGKLVPFPQTKTWQLLSKTSGLGNGESKIYKEISPSNEEIEIIAFQNHQGKYGIAISNPTNKTFTIDTTTSGINLSKFTSLIAYEASKNSDPSISKGTMSISKITNETFQIVVSPISVLSVLIN